MKTKIFALVIFSILLNDDSKRFILGFNCGEEQILYANKAFNVRYSLLQSMSVFILCCTPTSWLTESECDTTCSTVISQSVFWIVHCLTQSSQ